MELPSKGSWPAIITTLEPAVPYAYALVLSDEGKKQFRNATRELAKEQSKITVWAGDQAVCSPTITSMLNTNFVILNVASVTDDESYQAVLDALCAPSAE